MSHVNLQWGRKACNKYQPPPAINCDVDPFVHIMVCINNITTILI
jgi:hypothetical protein